MLSFDIVFKAIFFLLACCSILPAHGQTVAIALPLGSCGKCEAPLNKLSPRKTGNPAFVVLPVESRQDSAEIEAAHKFRKQGFRVVYSDKYWRLIRRSPAGDVVQLSADGSITWHKPLSELGNEDYKWLRTPLKAKFGFHPWHRTNGILYIAYSWMTQNYLQAVQLPEGRQLAHSRLEDVLPASAAGPVKYVSADADAGIVYCSYQDRVIGFPLQLLLPLE